MTIYIDGLELAWLLVSLIAAVLTLVALGDARADRDAVALKNGPARTIVARDNVRREAVRLMTQFALIGVVIPGLFVDFPTPLSPAVLLLMLVPVLLLLNSALDLRERRRLARITIAAIEAERRGLSVTVTDTAGVETTTDATSVTAEAPVTERLP